MVKSAGGTPAPRSMTNTLYYGDNLDMLRQHIKDESIDLIYLDPPFKSDRDYNVLFAEQNGSTSAAQIKAFEDTWHWDQSAARGLSAGGARRAAGYPSPCRASGKSGRNDMLAYLAMMAIRLVSCTAC